MKQLLVTFFIVLAIISCKNDTKSDNAENNNTSHNQNDGLITLRGDFIYDASQNAAVIQTNNQIYAVVVDDNMRALEKKVSAYKKEATDMVPVTLRAKRIAKPKGEEGWPFRLEIKEILKIEAPNPNANDIIKLEK